MQEREAAERAAREQGREPESEEGERVRSRDRRRIRLDDTGEVLGSVGGEQESSSLKPSYVEELEARTRAAEQKALDVQSRFEQLRAELRRETDQTRARLNRTADERAQREKAAFIAALLPVIDNLQRAMDAAEQGGSMEALLDGLHGTVSGFESALLSAGAEAVESIGAQFDPEIHEAVDMTEVEPERDGQVTAEYSRGFKMGGQLLRPARVQVGRARRGAHGAAE
ncbi:MAG TPA: nucleotide exchange factor GrpE [Pyrinomonadaceae bacterium]|jgi:molecular chaperone GrpE